MTVAVIGGGVVGLCLAHDLRHRGLDVVVVEADRCGSGCSGGNAGWICPALSAPLASPSSLKEAWLAALRPRSSPLSIRPRLGGSFPRWGAAFLRSATKGRYTAGRSAMVALNHRTHELFDALRDDGVSFELHRDGMIAGVRSPAALHRYAAGFAALAADGYTGKVEILHAPELREREPAFSDEVVGGIHLKSEAHVRPETLMAGLVARLRELGVTILENTPVTDLRKDGGGWRVVARDRDLAADKVVVAAGAASARVLEGVGAKLLLQPARGYSITSEGTGTRPRQVVYMPEVKVGCSPFGDDVRLVGTFELGAPDASAPSARVQRILTAWSRYLRDWRPDDAAVTWAGLRPMAPDSLPIMDELPGSEGLFVSTGHGMLGITTAPASAALLGELIAEGRRDPVLEPFRVGRLGRV
jgi:D-amino-acid dehydrogenase